MDTFLQFAVLGCGLGAAYIGLSVGMIATYRATGIINFAQGAMAVTGAYVFAGLADNGVVALPVGSIDLGSPPPVAAALGLALLCAAWWGWPATCWPSAGCATHQPWPRWSCRSA